MNQRKNASNSQVLTAAGASSASSSATMPTHVKRPRVADGIGASDVKGKSPEPGQKLMNNLFKPKPLLGYSYWSTAPSSFGPP